MSDLKTSRQNEQPCRNYRALKHLSWRPCPSTTPPAPPRWVSINGHSNCLVSIFRHYIAKRLGPAFEPFSWSHQHCHWTPRGRALFSYDRCISEVSHLWNVFPANAWQNLPQCYRFSAILSFSNATSATRVLCEVLWRGVETKSIWSQWTK